MTTVIFHQGILAADMRGTITNRFTGKITDINNNMIKIFSLNGSNARLRDDPLLAVGYAGNTDDVAKLQGIIQKGGDIENDYYIAKRWHSDIKLNCLALLVGKRKNYVIHFEYVFNDASDEYMCQDMCVVEHNKKKTIGIGSGHSAALLAIKKYNATIVEAIKDAMLIDPCTGGDIIIINTKCKSPVMEIIK